MKLPDPVVEKLRHAKEDPERVTVGVPFAKNGKVTIEYFYRGELLGTVTFEDTPSAMNDWFRSMVEAMNPGTDAGALK